MTAAVARAGGGGAGAAAAGGSASARGDAVVLKLRPRPPVNCIILNEISGYIIFQSPLTLRRGLCLTEGHVWAGLIMMTSL